MANEEQLAILQQGVNAWNTWRRANQREKIDLRGTDLSEATLGGANLREADLRWADLRWADLRWADLYGAKLSEANLIEAKLSSATLIEATLHGANLSLANLSKANLSLAKLSGATLSRATLNDTVFGDVDLSQVKGLEAVQHIGPSTIGIDTLTRSKGKLPVSFLRGCGLSDIQIERAKLDNPDLTSAEVTDIIYTIHALHVSGAIHYHSCFISYAHQDQAIAQQLHANLQDSGVRCWFAPEDLKIGDEYRRRIDESIYLHDKLLLILSQASVNSNWVKKEVETAFEKEEERGELVLFPIRLDDTIMDIKMGWPADIRRTRHIGDFRDWQSSSAYEVEFGRLLADLKAQGGANEQ